MKMCVHFSGLIVLYGCCCCLQWKTVDDRIVKIQKRKEHIHSHRLEAALLRNGNQEGLAPTVLWKLYFCGFHLHRHRLYFKYSNSVYFQSNCRLLVEERSGIKILSFHFNYLNELNLNKCWDERSFLGFFFLNWLEQLIMLRIPHCVICLF